MEKNNEILQELREITPSLSAVENKSPYTVSFFYFNELAENIVEKIRESEEPIYRFAKETPYSIPADYFANFSSRVEEKIKKETNQSEIFAEMEELSPLLNTISKKTVYTVPAGYFEKVEWNKSKPTLEKAKVRSLGVAKKLLNYAAAAIIIGLLAIGLFLFTGKQDTMSRADNARAVSEVKKLTEQEIVDFLKTNPPVGSIVLNSNNINKDIDIKNVVSEMSDKEIQRYLEENADQDEM